MSDASGYEWLTYKELADRLGIKLPAAEARARRHIQSGKWLMRRENVGDTKVRLVRIGVPAIELEAMRRDTEGATTSDIVGNTITHTINALMAELKASQEVIAGLHERVGRAEGEATVLRDALTHERAKREAAERDAEGLQSTLTHEQQALAHEREALASERQAGEAAEAARSAAEAAQEAAEVERDAAQREAAEWASGSPFARAWRALWWKGGG